MTYGIAAAGTGGHVFPALAVAEALVSLGVRPDDILFFGGDRFEASAVPDAGYELRYLRLQGLKRSLSPDNARIPGVVWNAIRETRAEIARRDIRVMLGAGGYVTLPTGLAARQAKVPCFVMEQNAHAGLANRIVARWARAAFTAFEPTEGLPGGVWVGNPVRAALANMDRSASQAESRKYYGLDPARRTVGVVGGSLGARSINEAVVSWVLENRSNDVQVLHLAGQRFLDEIIAEADGWKVIGFEDRMERFFAAVDLVVSRAGGMVAEITATGTPSLLIPGEFGSKGHQAASALALETAGAARVLPESELGQLGQEINTILSDATALETMAECARRIGKPAAATEIAREMVKVHG